MNSSLITGLFVQVEQVLTMLIDIQLAAIGYSGALMHRCRWRATPPVAGSGTRLSRPGLLFLLLVLLVSPPPAFAEKTDVVYLKGGDRLTGEIKQLDRGKLIFKTDHLATVEIEWDEILEIESTGSYTIEMQDGTEHFGSLAASPQEGTVRIVTQVGPVDVPVLAIIRMAPVKETFWAKLDGSFDLGYSYTSSSDVSQLSTSLDVRRRTVSRESKLGASAVITENPSAESTEREDASFSYMWFLKRRWFTQGLGQLQRNDELGLELRTLVAAAVGRHIVQNNRTRLGLAAGLDLNEEVVTGTGSKGAQVELLLASIYEIFQYDYPETDITISLLVFPSLTQWGRERAEFDAQIRREIFKDFFVDMGLYESFDSDPGASRAEKNDYGVILSVGWKF